MKVPSLLGPRCTRREAQRAGRRGRRVRDADQQIEGAVQHDTTAGERDGHPIVGAGHPTRGQSGQEGDQVVGVHRRAIRPSATRSGKGSARTSETRRIEPEASAAASASDNGSSIAPLWTSRRNNACTRCGSRTPRDESGSSRGAAACSGDIAGRVRVEQTARADEERRRVLAPDGHHVVGGVLQPGPESTRQTWFEARPGGQVAPQESEQVPARPAPGRDRVVTCRCGAHRDPRHDPPREVRHRAPEPPAPWRQCAERV